MYIKQLEKWEDSDWNKCFRHNSIPDKFGPEIKQILTLDSKEGIIANFDRLRDLLVINGIGANWMGDKFRILISSLFKGVRFEFHDIGYFLGGSRQEKSDTDYGLFKYSVITILNNFRSINQLDINFILKTIFIWGYVILGAIPMFIISFIFWQILICCGRKAFYFHN